MNVFKSVVVCLCISTEACTQNLDFEILNITQTSKMQPWKLFKSNKCLTSVAAVLTVTGIVILSTSSILFNSIIDGELVLTPNKHTFDVWKKTPMPITLDFYLFDWLNPEDVRNSDIKPRLEQRGPYVFREKKEKVDIVWNPNGTVSFRQLRWWHFDEEKSNGSLSDIITTLNAVAVTAVSQAKHLSYVMQKGMSLSMNTIVKDIHITKTVGELLFDGYKDLLIDVARNMPKIQNVDLPPFDKFGWFYMRNGSTDFDGLMTMGTGTNDVPLGRADHWNYKQQTGFYEGECGKVHGSAGEFWPPHVTREEIYLFSPDMCRAIGFQYEKDITVKGIKGYRFVGGEKTMDNGTKYPENECFCGGECVPSGVMNVTSCRYGAPGFISFPHFYIADPFYVDQFEGLNPNKEEHELSITLEPRTGLPLAVSAKFQINMLMTPNDQIGLYSDVPRLFFPMLWFKQEVVIPDDLASGLKQLVNLPCAANIFAYIAIAIGGTILVTLCGIYFYRKNSAFQMNKNLKTAHFSREVQPLNENGGEKSIIIIKPFIEKQAEKEASVNGFADT